MPISFSCDGCGKGYQVDDLLAGKRVKCKSCAFVISVPAPARSAPPRPSTSAGNRPALKSFGAPESTQSSVKARPASSPAPAPSNIYGLDEDEMEEVARPAPDDGLAPPLKRPGKVKSKSSRSSSSSDSSPIPGTTGPMLWVNLGFLGLIVILGLVTLSLPSVFPFFALIAGLTFVSLWLIGYIWYLKIAFSESAACGLMFLFLAPYSLYYLITRWSETKRPFFVSLVGGGVYLYAIMITGAWMTNGAKQPGGGQNQFLTAEELLKDAAVAPVAPVIPQVAAGVAAAPPAAVVSWKAQADPPAEKIVWPDGSALAAKVPPHYGSDGHIIYPAIESPFVILGGNDTDALFREVWDLRGPGKVVGRIPGRTILGAPRMLSADGAYFAGHDPAVPRKLVIYECANGQPIGAIPDGDNIPDFGEFIAPDQLMLGTTYNENFKIWDFKAGKVIREVNVGDSIVRESISLSPGRRYVAMSTTSPASMKLIDLTTGRVVGNDILPEDGDADYSCEGTAFSPDGTMLTGLFGCLFNAAHLVTWDVATGKRLSDFRYPGYQPFKPEHY